MSPASPDDALPTPGAVVFDAYGTLLDVNAAARDCAADLGERWQAFSDIWRAKQLEYSWLRALMGRHADFLDVTRDALDYAAAATGIDVDTALRTRLMDLYMTLPAFPEVPAVLSALRAAGLRLAILSNGSPGMLDAAVRAAGIAGALDAVLSVEDVGVFKPHPSVYQLACDRLEVPKERITFLSSNGWDVAGSAAFGFTAVWVNRQSKPVERLPAGPARILPDLTGLPALLGVGSPA